MQIEYAINAVKNGQPSVGLRGMFCVCKLISFNYYFSAKDGVVLATENKSSILYERENKIEQISEHIGVVYSGMGPDFR